MLEFLFWIMNYKNWTRCLKPTENKYLSNWTYASKVWQLALDFCIYCISTFSKTFDCTFQLYQFEKKKNKWHWKWHWSPPHWRSTHNCLCEICLLFIVFTSLLNWCSSAVLRVIKGTGKTLFNNSHPCTQKQSNNTS